jgi:hypothetical protein
MEDISYSIKHSIRRHNTERMKQKYHRKQRDTPYWGDSDPVANAGRYANHGCNCSCWMCGNPRRKLNELTIQEKKSQEKLNYDLKNLNNPDDIL